MNAKKADPSARQKSAGDVEPTPRTPDVAAHRAAQEMLGALESMCVDWESGGWSPNPGDAALALNLLLTYGWDKAIPAMVGFAYDQGLHGRQLSALREHWEAYVGVGNAWLRKRRVVLLPEREPPPAGFVEVPLILLAWDDYFPGAFALAGSQFAKHEEDRRRLLETLHETQGAFVRLDRLPDPREPCFGEKPQGAEVPQPGRAAPDPAAPHSSEEQANASGAKTKPEQTGRPIAGWKLIAERLSKVLGRTITENSVHHYVERAGVTPVKNGGVSISEEQLAQVVKYYSDK